jgi:NDP-sugar pyrophosphorylase family protein
MTTALIMAGGRSERMRARGDTRHKALRVVAGRRLFDWNLQALRYFGFREIYVAVNAQEHDLIQYLRSFSDLHLLIETAPLGTIGAARGLPERVTDAIVVNADNLTNLDLAALAQFHVAEDAALTIATHEEAFQIPWGKVVAEGDRVVRYEEKPRVLVRVSSGTYVLNRRAIDTIEPDQRLDLPDLVSALLAASAPVRAWAHSAEWIDVNDETALARAEDVVHASGTRWPWSELVARPGA